MKNRTTLFLCVFACTFALAVQAQHLPPHRLERFNLVQLSLKHLPIKSYDVIVTIPNDHAAYELVATSEDGTKSTSL